MPNSFPHVFFAKDQTGNEVSGAIDAFINSIADELIAQLASDNHETLRFLRSLPGAFGLSESLINLTQEPDGYYVDGSKLVVEVGATAQLAAALSNIVKARFGVGKVTSILGQIGSTAAAQVVYESYLEEVTIDFFELLDSSEDDAFLLRTDLGDPIGGLHYPLGVSANLETPLEAAERTLLTALNRQDLGNPSAGWEIVHSKDGFSGLERQDTFFIKDGTILATIAESQALVNDSPPVSVETVLNWDWALDNDGNIAKNRDILTEVSEGVSDFTVISSGSELALRLLDRDLQFDTFGVPIDKIGTSQNRPSSPGGLQALLGGNGADELKGNAPDQVYALGGNGNDIIEGSNKFGPNEAGNDVIYGAAGNDTLLGFAGDDRIDGGEDNDTIYGGGATEEGQNDLTGGPGNDTIYGGPQRDLIAGNDDDDTVYGSTGDDSLSGSAHQAGTL